MNDRLPELLDAKALRAELEPAGSLPEVELEPAILRRGVAVPTEDDGL